MAKTTDYSMKKLSTQSVGDLQNLRLQAMNALNSLRSSISKTLPHEARLLRRAIARISTVITARQDK